MAVIEVSNTKTIRNLIRYCENSKKCKIKSGWNVNPENAREEMLLTRQKYRKKDAGMREKIEKRYADAREDWRGKRDKYVEEKSTERETNERLTQNRNRGR